MVNSRYSRTVKYPKPMPGKRKKANGIRSERFCQVEFFLGISFNDLLVFLQLKKKHSEQQEILSWRLVLCSGRL